MGTRKQSIRARKNSSKKFPSLLFFVEFFLARFDYFRVPTISICPWVSKDDTLVPGFRIHTFSGYCTVVLHQCPFASVCLHTRDVYRLIPTIFVLRAVRSVGRVPDYRAGDRGFKPRPDQHPGSLNILVESAAFVMTSANG